MKKNRLLVTAAALLTAAGTLAGCKKDNEEVTISKVSVSSLQSQYALGQEIDWSQVEVSIEYSDGNVISVSDLEFDVETPVEEATKAIVFTNGLYELGALPEEKQYDISVALKEDNFVKKHHAMTVSVEDFSPSKYGLISFIKPQFITDYEEAIKDAGEGATQEVLETKFKKHTDLFTVGTMNTFRFAPVALFQNKTNGKQVGSVVYDKDVTVEECDASGTVTGVASVSDYKVVSRGIKFEETAIGKNYKVTIKSPKGFSKLLTGADCPSHSLAVHVEKGVNIHNGKELGFINAIKYDSTHFIGDKAQIGWSGFNGFQNGVLVQNNDSNEVFYDRAQKKYTLIDEIATWKNFLIKERVVTASEFATIQSAPAFFLAGNINLKASDIPAEYFIYPEECSDDAKYAAGGLRDGCSLYKFLLEQELTFNGNYCTVNASEIPLCKSLDSGGFHTYTSDQIEVAPGHARLFDFCGIRPEDSAAYRKSGVRNPLVKLATMKNFNTIGNTKTLKEMGDEEDATKKLMNLSGLIFGNSSWSNVVFDNIIAKQYMIGIFADQMIGAKEDGSVVEGVETVLKDSKMFDCANAGIFNYCCGNFQVKNTEMRRFGGACIINAGDDVWYEAGNTTFDSKCEFENRITGEEVYFAAVGATPYIDLIKSFSYCTNKCNSPFMYEDGTMDLITLTMPCDDYMASHMEHPYGRVMFNSDTDYPFSNDAGYYTNKSVSPLGYYFNMVAQAAGQAAPCCMTELGEMFFVNPYDISDQGPSEDGYCIYGITQAPYDSNYDLLNQYLQMMSQDPIPLFGENQPVPYNYLNLQTKAFDPLTNLNALLSQQASVPEYRTNVISGSILSCWAPMPTGTILQMNFAMPKRA